MLTQLCSCKPPDCRHLSRRPGSGALVTCSMSCPHCPPAPLLHCCGNPGNARQLHCRGTLATAARRHLQGRRQRGGGRLGGGGFSDGLEQLISLSIDYGRCRAIPMLLVSPLAFPRCRHGPFKRPAVPDHLTSPRPSLSPACRLHPAREAGGSIAMSSTERSATVKASDMTEDMQQDATSTAIQVGRAAPSQRRRQRQSTCRSSDFRLPCVAWPRPQALDKFTIEKDVAAYIKKEFDSKHGPTWHCIVGRNFGACTHRAAAAAAAVQRWPIDEPG